MRAVVAAQSSHRGRAFPDGEVAGVLVSALVATTFARRNRMREVSERTAALARLGVAIGWIRDADVDDLPRSCPAFARRVDGLAWLAERGIGPELTLVVSGAFPPDRLGERLDEVIRRRRQRRVPSIDVDPAWVVTRTEENDLQQRVREALFTVASAGFGTRGAVEEPHPGAMPLVVAAGAYDDRGAAQRLLAGPDWTRLGVEPAPEDDTRWLDLRSGLLLRSEPTPDGNPVRTVRWASARRPGVSALRAEAVPGRLGSDGPLTPADAAAGPPEGDLVRSRGSTVGSPGDVIAATAAESRHPAGDIEVVERLTALASGRRRSTVAAAADRRLRSAELMGFDRLLAEQRMTWARRWRDVDVRVPDDPEAQLGIRFAIYQLWSHSSHDLELAVGARGVTGHGYAGHVFWDADVYVLPALATIDPSAARAMLRYRFNRLPAARRRAAAEGRRGARFPWESAADGEEVTPRSAVLAGTELAILTGEQEEHVTADVAWAASFAAGWEGRAPSRIERTLIVEAARYWASRCRLDPDGHAHVERVIGPDEYHEAVDDNAYTNVMARWNLRRAAALGDGGTAAERRTWRALADALVDNYDPATGRYEQFTGYYGLTDLLAEDVAPPPVAADLLLGVEVIAASQLVKQPDVLMLHHLVPEETEPGSLAPNLDYYLPRTAHGSSLSPAIVASLLARAGRPDEALPMLRLALRMDLDDLTGTTGGGLHLATIGGAWQCLLFGFAGVRVEGDCLTVDPRLPAAWPRLELRFRALGRRVRLRVDERAVRVDADGPLPVRHGRQLRALTATSGARFTRGDE